MAQSDFAAELMALGFVPEDRGNGMVVMPYTVPLGRFGGQAVRLGFQVPGDYSLQPPGGLHVSPRLLPLKSGGSHPDGQVLESPLGAEWEYWSRPLSHWQNTDRTARAVMAHARHLFDTQ